MKSKSHLVQAFLKHWGARAARIAVEDILPVCIPGSGVVIKLVKSLIDAGLETAKHGRDIEEGVKRIATEEMLEPVGELLERLTGLLEDMAKRGPVEGRREAEIKGVIQAELVHKPEIRKELEAISGRIMKARNDVTKELKRRGYIARQNGKADSLFLNLGGNQSEVNRPDFKGAILLNPGRHLAFGACPNDIREFCKKVLTKNADGVIARREGVPGPPSDIRVEVCFVIPENGEPSIVCKANKSPIQIDGYIEALECHEGGYDWADIERFLTKVTHFCAQKRPRRVSG